MVRPVTLGFIVRLVGLVACRHVRSPSTAVPPAHDVATARAVSAPRPTPTLVVVDGAYGSQGPALPGAYEDSLRVVVTFDVTVPSEAPPGLFHVDAIELFDAEGHLGAALREQIDIGSIHPVPSDAGTPNVFAPHARFDGMLPAGPTRIWVHGWLTHVAHRPLVRVRVTAHVGDAIVTSEGAVSGEWATG